MGENDLNFAGVLPFNKNQSKGFVKFLFTESGNKFAAENGQFYYYLKTWPILLLS